MAPPEPPEPIVNFGMPKPSMKRSLIIISVSAETRSLHPVPRVLRVPNANANPRLSSVFRSGLLRVEHVGITVVELHGLRGVAV